MAPTLSDRILAHLRAHPIEEGAADVPREVTQDGIADALGARVAHVSRALKRLVAEGTVSARLAHPAGGSRRARAHALTARGRTLAAGLPPLPPEEAPPPARAAARGRDVSVPAGRQREFEELLAALDEARSSEGPRFVLLEGDAGSGKTRLLEAFATEVSRKGGARVLRGASAPTGAEQLVGPVGSALEPLGFDRRFRARTAGTPRERALAAAVESLVAAARAEPVALLLDDVQHAGASVADFLYGLLRALPQGSRVLVVAAVRREEEWALPNGPLYTALMPLRGLPGARHVDLAPLDRASVAALLADAQVHVRGDRRLPDALVERVWRESGGNASFALAMGEQLADGVDEEDFFPPSVRAAVEERFRTLAPEQLAILQQAAVAGPELGYDPLVRAVAPEREQALVETLDHLIDKLFLEEVPGASPDLRLRFRHPKVREALLAGLTATRRRFLEGRLAAAHQA
jgi:predicted ATPase